MKQPDCPPSGHGDDRPAWLPTACILCECNCGLEVQLGGDDGRHLTKLRGDRRHPASRGYACEKPHRLDYYQHGPDRLTSPLRRRADGTLRGDRLGHRDRRGRRPPRRGPRRPRRRGHLLLRRRRPGQPPARRLRHRDPARARLALPLERAGPGEDRRVLGRRPHDGRRDPGRLRALRRRAVPRQEPVALALDPAGPGHAQGDRRRPGAHADRDRPAPDRDRRARRPPPARSGPAPTPTSWPRSSRS